MNNAAEKAQFLKDDALELIAARFRTLGEPSRLKLIRALIGGEKSVTQLTELARLTQANTSRHLQTLTDAGILGRRKEGLNVLYFIADNSILGLCQHVCGAVQRRHATHAATLQPVAGELVEAGWTAKAAPRSTVPNRELSPLPAPSAGDFQVSFD
jgi:ArsR family transcriptional regulator